MENGNGEKTRTLNYFKKLSESVDIRKAAYNLILMDEVIKAAKEEQEKIVNFLVKFGNQLDEVFPELKKRVKFKEGKEKTTIPTREVYLKMQDSHSLDEFLKVVKVVEASLKKLDGGDKIIATTKIHLNERGANSAGIYKMTKKELKEYQERLDNAEDIDDSGRAYDTNTPGM